jgi:hypothetical protein
MSLLPRTLRLKEEIRLNSRTVTPTDHQINLSNGTLEQVEYAVSSDENGFITFPGRTGRKRLVFIGDSVVENLYGHEGQRMCDMATLALAERDGGCQVINAGQSGATVLHAINSLINKIVPLKPDGILLSSGAIDVYCCHYEHTLWSNARYPSPFNFLKLEGWDTADLRPEPDYEGCEQLLHFFCLTAAHFGIPVALATYHTPPWRAEDFPGVFPASDGLPRHLLHGDTINALIRKVAAGRNVPLCDFRGLTEGRTDLTYDNMHLNREGAIVHARILADFAAGFLNRAPVRGRGLAATLRRWLPGLAARTRTPM